LGVRPLFNGGEVCAGSFITCQDWHTSLKPVMKSALASDDRGWVVAGFEGENLAAPVGLQVKS
jgi:hypothetical protein